MRKHFILQEIKSEGLKCSKLLVPSFCRPNLFINPKQTLDLSSKRSELDQIRKWIPEFLNSQFLPGSSPWSQEESPVEKERNSHNHWPPADHSQDKYSTEMIWPQVPPSPEKDMGRTETNLKMSQETWLPANFRMLSSVPREKSNASFIGTSRHIQTDSPYSELSKCICHSSNPVIGNVLSQLD